MRTLTGRRIVQVDSVFETALGLVLVSGAAAGWLDATDFPDPTGTALIIVFGCMLLIAGAALWRSARKPVASRLLLALAVANLLTVAAAVAWRVLAEGFSTSGSALTLATAVTLAVLAGAQLSATRRP